MTKAKTALHMKTFFKYIFLAATIAAFAGTAYATPTLKIVSGGTTMTIADNGGLDLSPVNGVVLWSGTIGNWSITVDTGYTYPNIGSPTNPIMDLEFGATSTSSGTLKIYFSEDGFTVPGSANVVIGGTMSGAVGYAGYATYGGSSNNLFDTSNLLTSLPVFSDINNVPPDGYNSSPFSGTMIGNAVSGGNPYSLTQYVLLYQTGAGQITGDAGLSVPDSGTTLLLLGAGLAGLSLVNRLRRRIR